MNHLRQIGLGWINHESAHGFLPSSGWHPKWVGDADHGFGRSQPGGWVYSTLPYIEEQALFDLSGDGDPDNISSQQKVNGARLAQSPVEVMNCPSRRPAQLFDYILPTSWDVYNANTVDAVVRQDYAANSGRETGGEQSSLSPTSYAQAKSFNFDAEKGANHSGVSFKASEVKLKQVKDGTTKTYMVGEKYLNADSYFNGRDGADNHSMYQGYDRDVNRWTGQGLLPLNDRPGYENNFIFGSAHSSGWYVVLCDASVQLMSYDLDPLIHERMGSRADGEILDAPRATAGPIR